MGKISFKGYRSATDLNEAAVIEVTAKENFGVGVVCCALNIKTAEVGSSSLVSRMSFDEYGDVTVSRKIKTPVTTINSGDALDGTMDYVYITIGGTDFTVLLPSAANNVGATWYIYVRTTAGTNDLVLDANGTDSVGVAGAEGATGTFVTPAAGNVIIAK